MNATDYDYGANAALSWSVQELDSRNQPQPTGKFLMDNNGLIRSKGRSTTYQLDRERQPMHRLLVTVSDGGSPPRSASTTITVHLQDYNDNAPKFNQSLFKGFSVNENAPIGQMVGRLFAGDEDNGINARLVYSIPTDFHDRRVPFRVLTKVEPSTAANKKPRYWAYIFTDGPIDREALLYDDRTVLPLYTLKLLARDSPTDVKACRFGETHIQVRLVKLEV